MVVPAPYAASIANSSGNALGIMVDTSFEPYRREAFRHRSIPSQRQSINLTNIAGEGTVNTEGLWRREQTEWSMGAGQYSLDRKGDSQETRFLKSKGVDVFSFPLQATLLPDTYATVSAAGAGILMSRCGDYVVVVTTVAGVPTVTYYNPSAVAVGSAWTGGTTCTFGSTYGGTAPTTINSICTNDSYAFLATNSGVWFCQIGTSSVFQLYAANDLTTGYTGGYDIVRWANDQLIASKGPRLYAFQARDGSTNSPYGSAPSDSSGSVAITNIIGQGTFLSGAGLAQVFTQTPHNLVTGQKVTISGTQMGGDITSLYAAGTGKFTATCAIATGLVVGQSATVSITYTNGKTINENVTVSSVASTGLAFTCNTTKIITATNFSAGSFISNEDQYGFNTNYTVTVTPPTANSLTSISTSGGYVTYTVNQLFSFSVGDYITVAGVSVAGYNGTFVVTSVGGSSGAYTATVANAQTGAATGGTVTTLSRSFIIPVPKTNGASATGGTLTIPVSPDALFTHTNPSWVWSDAVGGETQVYFAGYIQSASGKNYSGCIYRSDLPGAAVGSASQVASITGSSTTQPWQLNAPIQALPMSPDEYPVCIESYLNFIFIGTNRGIRMTQTLSIYDPTATATGDLKSGPLIPNILQPVTNPVTAIIGDGRFIWFAWSNYDGSSTGLGKLDLQTYIAGDPLAPAYASDLMVTGQGVITHLDWNPYTNTPIMAVTGLGVYAPYATNSGGNMVVSKYVTSGTLTSGIFDYGISDNKIPIYFDYTALTPYGSTITATDSVDGAAATSATSGSYVTGNGYAVTQTRGRQFTVNVTLNAATHTTSYDTTPTLQRWVLKSWPAVVAGTAIMVVIQNFSVDVADGQEMFQDPYYVFSWLENLRQIQDIVTYSEGPLSVTGVIDAIDMLPHKMRDTYDGGYEGDLVVTIKTIGNYVYTPVATH